MLETFGWIDGVVLDTQDYAVLALESPTLDAFVDCPDGTIYGVVVDGQNAILHRRRHGCAMPAETVFATSDREHGLSSPGGRLLLVVAKGKDSPFVLTEVEPTGRLRYIDGCTDSLLIPPVRKGEPCLNFLHIPPNVEQTMHTHPSDRVGVVLDGRGQCVTPEGVTELVGGVIWRIPANAPHRFRTDGKPLRIVAFHPDSDFGADHDDHPMLNKSLVDGVSAKHLTEIRTRA